MQVFPEYLYILGFKRRGWNYDLVWALLCVLRHESYNYYCGISGPRVVGKRVKKLESWTKVLGSQKCHKITFKHLIFGKILNFL